MNCRTQIRNAVISGLTTDLVGYNIFNYRLIALDPSELPCVCVYTELENVERHNMDSVLQRTLTLRVEVYNDGDNAVDENDEALNDVEPSVLNSLATLELMTDPVLKRFESLVSDESNRRTAAVRLEYDVMYRTAPEDPETFLD